MNDRMQKYYQCFIDRKVGDLVISIAQVVNDIPILRYVGVDLITNHFIIEFNIASEPCEMTFTDEYVDIYQGVSTEKIARISLKILEQVDIRNVDIFLYVNESFERFERRYLNQLNKTDLNEALAKIGKYDLIDRQLQESRDLIKGREQATA